MSLSNYILTYQMCESSRIGSFDFVKNSLAAEPKNIKIYLFICKIYWQPILPRVIMFDFQTRIITSIVNLV